MFVGVALGLDHVAVDDDRAVPVPGYPGQLGERLRRAGRVDLDPARVRFVDVEEPAGDDRARPGVSVLPQLVEAPAAQRVGGRGEKSATKTVVWLP